jgi:hypothetical protein
MVDLHVHSELLSNLEKNGGHQDYYYDPFIPSHHSRYKKMIGNNTAIEMPPFLSTL